MERWGTDMGGGRTLSRLNSAFPFCPPEVEFGPAQKARIGCLSCNELAVSGLFKASGAKNDRLHGPMSRDRGPGRAIPRSELAKTGRKRERVAKSPSDPDRTHAEVEVSGNPGAIMVLISDRPAEVADRAVPGLGR